ncbi:MAG: hypothetical protein E6R06_00135 [Mycobacterium sp.]|nr:MAG: hypothetical protein E6R06_00135 [Mycobacterium sp.]
MSYDDMPVQRTYPNRSRVCHCCGGGMVRIQVSWPKSNDPDYRGAVCPTCDVAPAASKTI